MAMADAMMLDKLPGGGLASFLTSNMDEIEDNVLAFGRPAGINSMGEIANRMAQMGRGGDNFVVHASEREMMVPREVVENNPDLRRQIMESIAAEGGDPQAYIVGNDANSINPMTGQREFFLKKLVRGIKKVFKKIAPIVLPIALAFTPLGAIYGAALGSGIGTLVQGGSVKDAFRAAAISGLTAGVFKGVTGSEGSFGANVKAGLSDPLGRLGQTASGLGSTVTGGGFTGSGNLFTPYAAPVPAAAPAVAQGGTGGANVVDKNAIKNTLKQVVADAQPSLLDRTKDLFFPETSVTVGGETLINPSVTDVLRAGGIDPLGATAAQQTAAASMIKDAAPGLFRTYAPLALAGTAIAAAGGAFTPPPQQDLTQLGYQPPTQEELDAVSVFPNGVPDPVQYVPSDLLIAPPVQYRPEDLLQQASFAPAPNSYQIAPPPPFPPIQFAGMNSQDFMQQGQIQGGQNFGFDRFGNPIQSVYTAAEGGAINGFPRRSGFISGPGTETSDSIPAMLSDGEFVMTAQAVRGLGGGSREKGVRKMYDMMRMFEGGAVT